MTIIDMSPVLYGERLAEYRRMLNEKREAGNALTPALFHEFLLYNRKVIGRRKLWSRQINR